HPASEPRRRADTSIGIATSLVKHGEADAVVSAGNTGATMAAALLLLGRIRGIDRPALCGMLPTTKGKPACLLDAGATMDADEHNILQFARMAARFMEQVHGVERPSVGLINVGEEAEKGGRLQQTAHALLSGAEDLNFYGNIEGRDVTRGITDICVTDGFTGNVLAKGMEGVVDVFVDGIRNDIFGGPLGQVAGLFALRGLSKFRGRMPARRLALQTLFEIDFNRADPKETWQRGAFRAGLTEEAAAFAWDLVEGVLKHRKELDTEIAQLAPEFPIDQMARIDRNVL